MTATPPVGRAGTARLMLRYAETADTIVGFFDAAEIRDDIEIAAAGRGLYALYELATSLRKRLTLSFHGVTFMESAMIGIIVLVNKASKANRVVFRVADVEPTVMETFRAVRLHRILRFDRSDETQGLLGASIPVPVKTVETTPCPHCGKPLATKLAKQCLHCGADWH